MARPASVFLLFTIGLLQSEDLLSAAAPKAVTIAALPKLQSGVPAYPAPFMAVARTPHAIAPLAGRAISIQTDFGCLLDPIRGTSQWNVIDVPAGSGRLEVLHSDSGDYRGMRRGPFAQGTLWTNLRQAIEARKKE